jgi:hypothetical protein
MINNLAAGSSIVSGIAGWITATAGVILLVIVSVMVLQFAASRRFMGMAGYLVVAIIVFLIFFHPTFISSIATELAAAAGIH